MRRPKTGADFWQTRIVRNATRDRDALREPLGDAWRLLVVWECAPNGRYRSESAVVVSEAEPA